MKNSKRTEMIEKHVALFRELIDNHIEPGSLRTVLTQLHMDYSRRVLKTVEEEGVPHDMDSQLYYLGLLIEALSPETKAPEFNSPHTAAA